MGKPIASFIRMGLTSLLDATSPSSTIATYRNGDGGSALHLWKNGVVEVERPHPEVDREWFEKANIPLSKMPR